MLQSIRDNSQGLIVKIIIGLIIGVFALFGAESIVGGFFGGNQVVSVNGEDITEQDLAVSLQNLMAQIGADFDNFDEELMREVALGQLIEDKLLMQAAENSGMAISEESIDREILRIPQFQIGGVFDADLARRSMAAQFISPQMYRASLAERMLMSQLANAYASTSFVTDADIARLASLQSQTRDFRFLAVPLANRTLGEAIPPEDIEAYYAANPAEFTSEEQVSVEYVILDKNRIFDEVIVDAARVLAQYETERSMAVSSIERRVAHILFEIGAGSNESRVIAEAAEVRARIDAGEDFGELAREYSVDVISAEDDGDIGYTDGSVFPDALEQALLELEVGEVSAPVVTEFGVHLVKLTEYELQDYPLFEDVSERIERNLKSAEVDQHYFSHLEALANLAFETFDLQAINEDLGLEIQQSSFFGRNGGTSIVTSDPNIIRQAFSDDVLGGELNSDVIELNANQAAVLRLAEYRPAQLQPLQEVRAEIAVMLRSERERAMAREVGESILASLRAGEEADDILAAESLSWNERTGVTRNQFDLNIEVVQSVFRLPAPDQNDVVRQGFTLTNGAYVVIELQVVNAGATDSINEDERSQLAAALLENQGRVTFDALLANLQNDAKIR